MTFFSSEIKPTNIPLAEEMRPNELSELKGQSELLQEGSLLRQMLELNQYSSFLLWGPPGSGKTTIARLIEKRCTERFVVFSAVMSGIKEVKDVMKEAEFHLKTTNQATIIFIDEIHRFNKSQQDAFLPYVESGSVILIGATTENPSFEVIPALLSRCHVFVLKSLSEEDLLAILRQATKKLNRENDLPLEVQQWLCQQTGGDARKTLSYLEILFKYFPAHSEINVENASRILTRKAMFYDKNAEEHYNLISALHKSLRGSDPQAGLYWLARMLEAGEDPLYIVRRLIRFASEDIGLADPQALSVAISVKETIHFVGMPEANIALAQLVIYLGTAPKSNAAYIAYGAAREDAIKTSHYGVPLHLRNAPTKLMKDLDYSKGYVYAHDTEDKYYYQRCFPDQMPEKSYYNPGDFGFEKEIKKRLDWWNKKREEQKPSR